MGGLTTYLTFVTAKKIEKGDGRFMSHSCFSHSLFSSSQALAEEAVCINVVCMNDKQE